MTKSRVYRWFLIGLGSGAASTVEPSDDKLIIRHINTVLDVSGHKPITKKEFAQLLNFMNITSSKKKVMEGYIEEILSEDEVEYIG